LLPFLTKERKKQVQFTKLHLLILFHFFKENRAFHTACKVHGQAAIGVKIGMIAAAVTFLEGNEAKYYDEVNGVGSVSQYEYDGRLGANYFFDAYELDRW